MSEIFPEPEGSADFFSSLTPEDVSASEFTAPNVPDTDKPKWWNRAPKGGKADDSPKRAPKTEKAKPTARPLPKGGLRGPLTQIYVGIGMSLMPFDPSCGRTVIENAPKCAEALEELSRTNTAIRNFLIGLCTTSAWGAVVMAHAPIIMAISMHHIPALKKQQEKMVGEFAEMMANGFQAPNAGDDSE